MSNKRKKNFDRAAAPHDDRASHIFLLNQIKKYESPTCWSHQDRLDLFLLIKTAKPNETLSYIAGALETRNPEGVNNSYSTVAKIHENPGRNARPADIAVCLTEAIASIKHDLMCKSIDDFLNKIYVWNTGELPPIVQHDNRQQFDNELLALSLASITPEQQYEFRRQIRAYTNACYAYDQDPENYRDSEAYGKYPHIDMYERPESPTMQFYGWIDTGKSMAEICEYSEKAAKRNNTISYAPQ